MTRVRGAVGVCAVSATLFLNCAAVAAADTGSEGGDSPSQSSANANPSPAGAAAGGPTSTIKNARPGAVIAGVLQDRLRTTVRDFTGALNGSGTLHLPPKVTIFPKPRTQQKSSEPEGKTANTSTSEAAPEADSPVAEPTSPDPTVAGGTATTLAATEDTTPASPAGPTPPSPAATIKLGPPPLSPLAASVAGSVHSAANSVKDAVDALPALLAALPTSKDPIGDVLATVQSMLISVGISVTTISEIPGDLSTLLGFPAATTPPVATVTGGAPLHPATAPATVSPIDLLPVLLAPAPADTAVVAGPVTVPPVFAGTTSVGLGQELTRTAPLSLHGASSAGSTASVLERAVSKILVPVSIAALAALALPGVGGLLVLSVLGVRIGYRQAKANFVLQASGISRFAGPGPLGVVRSGSFIALHTRAAHPRSSARTAAPAVVSLRAVSSMDRAA